MGKGPACSQPAAPPPEPGGHPALLRPSTDSSPPPEGDRLRQILEAVQVIGAEMVREPELSRLLTAVAEHTAEILGAEHCAIYLWEPEAGLLLPAAQRRPAGLLPPLRLGQGVAGLVAESRRGMIVNRYPTSPHALPSIAADSRLQMMVAEPLLAGDGLVGVILAAREEPDRPFCEEERGLLAVFAAHTAIAIETARQLAASRRRAAQLSQLIAVTRSLMVTTEPAQVYREIYQAVQALLPEAAVRVWLCNAAGTEVSLAAGVGFRLPEGGSLHAIHQGEPWFGAAAFEGQPVTSEDVTVDSRFVNQEWARAEGLVSVLLCPMLRGTRLLGYIAIFTRQRHRFDPDEIDLFRAFAAQAATAIENARLFETTRATLAERTRQEEEYRTVLQATIDGFWLADEQGRLLNVNEAYCRMSGYSRDELLGMRIQELEVGEGAEAVAERIRRMAREGSDRFEGRHRRKDGALIDLEISANHLPMEGGWIVFFLRDITERKRAAAALAERTRQLEVVCETTAELIRELDLSRLLTLIIRRAVELIRSQDGTVWLWDEREQALTPGAWVGMGPWLAEVRLQPGEGVAGAIATTRAGMIVNDFRASPLATPLLRERNLSTALLGQPLVYRGSYVGSLVLGRAPGDPSFTEEDLRLLATFADQVAIAIENARLFREEQDRRRHLEALRVVGQEITRELDLDRVLALITQRANTVLDTRAATVRLWDESDGRLLPQGWTGEAGAESARVPLRMGEGVAGTVAERRAGMLVNDFRTSPYATPALLSAGHTAVMAEPLLYHGRLIGVLSVDNGGSGRRFTPRDQELLRAFAPQAAIAIENARLYAEVKASYARLQQAQAELIRTEKLRGLGQMAAGIAHDLNNMLAAVLGQTELLKLQARDPTLREGLATLETAATDGAQVVRRLQDFARQRPGLPLGPCRLDGIVREAVEITRPRWKDEAQRRNGTVQVDLELPPDLPLILGNPPEIREVLTNLILNAVDAMPQGGALRLGARLVPAEEPGCRGAGEPSPPPPGPSAPPRHVELIVADTGVGMSAEIQGRIFEPFFTTKGVRGTGLGLSVVYGILERHGGRIDVRSAPGRGTVFTLRFRAVPACAAPAPAPLPVVLPARRLLLIDDEPAVRQTLASLLRTRGHTVLVAEDGPAGLALLSRERVDCVLCDLGMPEMTGWEVAKRMAAEHPGVPLLLLTGWGEQMAGERPADVTVQRILGKPIRIEELLSAIREATAAGA